MYSKRAGTSGIRGQLYATKIISLLYFRATHDDAIEEFQLASNVDNIGAFDDICFRAKVKGLDKPVAVFIQAKHRENEKQTLKNDLAACFDSYLKIRKSFEPNKNDLLFNGTFDDTECLFVIYTTAKSEITINEPVTRSFSSKLNDLIATCQLQPNQTASTVTVCGMRTMQPHKQSENVELLCKLAVKEQISSLAELIARFVYEEDFQTLLSDELAQLYHVILAQKVFQISKIHPDGHRIATFRHDFFDTNEEYLVLFKDTLFKEILQRRKIEPADVDKLLSECSADPTDATKLSKVIGTVVTYNNGRLECDKRYKNDFRPQLETYVSRGTVNKATELAARDILLPRQFKVPAAFGNKDLTISGSDEKIEKRLNYLASKIIDLLDKCEASKMVTIDDSLGSECLQLNGGLAGAIGNIFVLDDNTKLIKITDNKESLEDSAKRLYELLEFNDKLHNILEYRFNMKVNMFPKLSFDFSEYEKNIARDFLNKLIFYSSQANEDGVETFLKEEITEYQRDHPNYFQVKADAIFLKYHDEIQKWWMRPKQEAAYLTRDCDLFQQAINNIIKDLLLYSINATYMSKMKHYNYSFSEDAVRSLDLQDQHSSTVIIAENTVLTVVKVMQYLKDKEHVVLDLEYIVNLPTNDRNALRTELKNTEKILIFVCDKLRNSRNEKRTLENIAEAINEKRIIVITNNIKSFETLKKYKFPKPDNIVQDKKNSLVDMSEDSQNGVLESATVQFQGVEVRLDLIVDDESKSYVKGDVLNKIISEETISVGKSIVNKSYDEMKHSYVDRRLRKSEDGVDIHFKTLIDDIEDDVILVTAEPGMGKSTLLTHLSLKTKVLKPEVWIVRINLLEYSREFSEWKEERTDSSLQSLKFMSQVIVRDKLGNDNNVDIELEEDNSAVYLKHCTGDQWTAFELKLFLHFYNKGKLIFLFDGFDEICPHYTDKVIRFLKSISNGPVKQKMWITSRPYSEVKASLQREFGSSYNIDYFSYMEMQKYLETFWEHNLRLEELSSEQLENVKSFIEYVLQLKDVKLYGFAMQLHSVYVNAALYLSSEVKYRHIPLWIYKKNYDESFYFPLKDDLMISLYREHRDGNPLHLLLAAAFVESSIRRVSNNTQTWNLEDDTFTFYERFLETKMKIIRFQEKGEMNIWKPDIIITCDKELINYSSKHRKLAAFATFQRHTHQLFTEKDLEEIKEMITFIERGGDKTGLIDNVANGIPEFILTEYFAVEYICDCLKKAHDSEQQASWMDFIFNVIYVTETYTSLRNVFDYKIKIDKTLMSALEKYENVMFNLIMQQGRAHSDYIADRNECPADTDVDRHSWILLVALSQHLHNSMQLFVKILNSHLNKTNLKDFLDIAKASQLLLSAYTYKNEVLLCFALDIVRKMDESMFSCVLRDSLSFLSDSTISSCVGLSTQEVVQRLLVDCVDSEHISPSSSSGFSSGPITSSLSSRPSASSLSSRPSTSRRRSI